MAAEKKAVNCNFSVLTGLILVDHFYCTMVFNLCLLNTKLFIVSTNC